MGTVSRLPSRLEREEHLSGEAFCFQCGHTWTAVAPVGTVELECPECHTMKGVFKYGCEPKSAWVCGCGCYLFMLSGESYEMICWQCGTVQRGFTDGR
jgi:hypothetical protein